MSIYEFCPIFLRTLWRNMLNLPSCFVKIPGWAVISLLAMLRLMVPFGIDEHPSDEP